MKHFIGVISLLLSACAYSYSSELRNIEQLQWHHRVLILWSTTPSRDLEQLQQSYQAEITDRQLILLLIDNQASVVSNYSGQLNSRLADNISAKFPQKKGRFFLIGKDGGLKDYGQKLNMTAIFSTIDQMPMRRQEQLNSSQP
jgi:hypothetical protein